jgi:hypothetical protein
MKTSYVLARLLVIAAILGAMSIYGCSGEVSFTTAKLTEATMCLGVDGDFKPLNPTDKFSVTRPRFSVRPSFRMPPMTPRYSLSGSTSRERPKE